MGDAGKAGEVEDILFPRRAALCSYRITGRQRALDAEKSRVHGASGPNLRSLPVSSQIMADAPSVSILKMRSKVLVEIPTRSDPETTHRPKPLAFSS